MTAQAVLLSRPAIQVRRLGLKISAAVPKHFFGDDPFLSAFYAAMSTVFPDGERFFIDSVRRYQKELSDPNLISEVRKFIGQEAHHGQEHEAFNAWLDEKGYPIAPVLKNIQEGLSLARERLGPRQQLAMTLALEHFTAIMANQFLTRPEISEALHPEIRALFSWHAVEETEHKAVAYDVYEATGGGYWNRVLMMVQITILFWMRITAITHAYLKSEGNGGLMRMLRGGWWLVGNPGPLRRLIPEYLDYFRPGFHPWQHDNRALIAPLQDELQDRVIARD